MGWVFFWKPRVFSNPGAREIITKEMNRIIHFKPNLRYILLACVKVVREAGRGRVPVRTDFQLDNKIQPYVCKWKTLIGTEFFGYRISGIPTQLTCKGRKRGKVFIRTDQQLERRHSGEYLRYHIKSWKDIFEYRILASILQKVCKLSYKISFYG